MLFLRFVNLRNNYKSLKDLRTMQRLEGSGPEKTNPDDRCALYNFCPIPDEPALENRKRRCCFTSPATCIYRNDPPYVKQMLRDLSEEQYLEIIQRLIARPPIT